MTPLTGFAPDLETTTPGVLTDCAQLIPYQAGMESAPGVVTPPTVPVLAAECLGATVVTKRDDTRRTFAGTTTKLYELASGSWTDVSGSAYTGGADTRWMFAQFGDTTVAANRADTIQSSSSGAFASIGTAPKAEIVFAVGTQVMALNTNDGAEKTDGWHCCASFNVTDWTPSIATQAARGQLVASPGKITAGARLGEYAIAYKQKSLYIGQYVGGAGVWDWIPVIGVGCIGKEAVCEVDGLHFFVGEDNFWLFDGTRPTPMGDVVRQWFFDRVNAGYLYRTKCIYERQKRRVWVFYPGNGSTVCNEALVIHLGTKQWGRANRNVEAVVNFIAPSVTIDGLDALYATIDAVTTAPFDSAHWSAGAASLAVVNTSHQLQTLNGNPSECSFTTGDLGNDDAFTLLKRIRLRFAAGRAPTTASVSTQHKKTSGDQYEAGLTSSINDGKFDVLRSARWHKATVTMTGSPRVTGIDSDIKVSGRR